MTPRTIATVIPTFNRADLLGRAIESVFAQLRRPDEIVVVDDGSSDHTQDVVEKYGRELVFVRKQNGGVSSARNVGVRKTSSDFVAFLDSDDFWYEEHLERMESAINATDARAGLYFSDQHLASSRGTTAWKRAGFSIDGSHDFGEDGRPWAFLDKQPMTINACVVERNAYLGVGGCDERLPIREDTHLFLKLALSLPLCGVAGYSGMLTAADSASLSSRYSSADLTYLNCTVLLYTDILRSYRKRLTADEKRLLSQRLAAAHWSLAKRNGSRSAARTLLHIGRVVANDPAMLGRRLSRRARALVR